jgi:hypothetical protein
MAAYTRQSSFADGNTINASLFNNEYDAVAAAFVNTSGHKHDGTTGEGPVIGLIGDANVATPLNKVLIDSTNDHIEFYVDVSSSAVQQAYMADGVFAPVTDSDVDLGTSSLYFKNAYIDTVTTTGNVTVGGTLTVTGAATIAGNLTFGDAASDTVAFSADVASHLLPSADNTYDIGASGSEWKDLYIDGVANIDSLVADTADINGGTVDGAIIGGASAAAITGTAITGTSFVIGSANIAEAELETIDGITAGTVAASKAVVVDANKDIGTFRNVTIDGTFSDGNYTFDTSGNVSGLGTIGSGAITSSGTVTFGSISDGTITATAFVDEDNMSSDSATLIPTQQSVKAYVDSQIATEDTIAELNDTTISSVASANILIYDGTDSWDNKAISGDATIATTGALTIASGAVETAMIAADAVDGTKLADNAIDSEHYTDGSIDTAHINDLNVTTAKIAADAITGAKIADDAIESEHYAAGSIDTAHIANDQITAALIADNAIDSDMYVDGSIDTAHYAAGSINSTALGADSVTAAKIADDVVNSEHLAAGGIDLEHMSVNSIDSDQYVDGSIDTAHIADDQITYAKIQNISADERILGRVSGADGVIEELTKTQVLTFANIEDGADVTDATNVTAAGALMDSECSSLASVKAINQGLTTSSDVTFADVTVSGDLTVSGDTTTVNTATLAVEDPLVSLATGNNSSDAVDIGIYGLYDTSGSQDLYGGLFRDANDSGKWKLFKDNQAVPTTTVNTSGTGYAVGTLVSNLEGSVTGNVTGTASTATEATNITAVANNSANETVYPAFVDGATGTQGIETDTGLTYNPSTGLLSSAGVTASGTVTYGSLSDGSITITAFVDEDDMSSDSATLVPTQQSVKAFVEAQAGGIASVAADTTPQLGGDLDVQTNDIVSTSNRPITITPNGSGDVIIDGLKYPQADGSAGYFLKTDGSAQLSWTALTAGAIPNDLIDSQHYAAASIDNEHLADDAVDSDEIAAGAIDNAHLATGAVSNAKIGNNEIDSQHYVDGSIDNAHLAANSVDSDNYVDDSIDAAHLANSINTDIATGVTAGTTAAAALPKAGGTMTGHLTLNDNAFLRLGTSSDMDIYHNGTNSFIQNATGDLHVDVANDMILDVGGGDIRFYLSGSEYGKFDLAATNLNIYASVQDGDMKFHGNDGGSAITALTLDMSDAGAAIFNNNVTAYSDERLKSNIETIDNGLDKVSQMRGVTFIRNEKKGSGVIAQELEKIAPELVKTADDDMGTKSVAYGNIVAYLIEAVKELKSEIEQLKKDK